MTEEPLWQGWSRWLSSNDRGWRICVGAICVIALAFFLHFREVRVAVLELNKTASRTVVARVDFSFPDYETTIVLKQQAIQGIGKIYQLEDKEIREVRRQFEEGLIRNKKWQQEVPKTSFEEMYEAADALEMLLIEARFTDPRTLQKIRALGLSDPSYFEFIAEETPTQPLSESFWHQMALQLGEENAFRPEAVTYLIRAFSSHEWTLAEDTALEQSLRAQVSRTIPEKYTRVQAGEQLIEQGERVTSRHITMMQAMKQAIDESRKEKAPFNLAASFLLALIFVIISALYFRIGQLPFVRSLSQISLFVSIVILTLALAKLTEFFLVQSESSLIESIHYPLFVPFATILICILLSPQTALFAATFLSILLSIGLAVDHGRFLVLNLVTSIVVIICSRSLRKRTEVFRVMTQAWLSAIPVLYAYTLGLHSLWNSALLINVMASLAFLLITAILVVGLLPALETLFGILTDISLMEYLNPNSDLLRSFAAAVPGTYHHSLVLGNLSEACANAIGAGGLFCRAATLYHDIGKMRNPAFYTENQQGTLNVHQLFTPEESAQVIISHVPDGVEIAHQHHLPESFIEIIREHHGTTLAYYFYQKAIELRGKQGVDETLFRYPGPKPKSRESVIIMICDTIEAASRSLDEVSEAKLTQLVHEMIREKAEDGQFDECKLTFAELTRIKETLAKSLLLSHHIRIKYPKREKEGGTS